MFRSSILCDDAYTYTHTHTHQIVTEQNFLVVERCSHDLWSFQISSCYEAQQICKAYTTKSGAPLAEPQVLWLSRPDVSSGLLMAQQTYCYSSPWWRHFLDKFTHDAQILMTSPAFQHPLKSARWNVLQLLGLRTLNIHYNIIRSYIAKYGPNWSLQNQISKLKICKCVIFRMRATGSAHATINIL
jgi:hypothetical protein